MENDDGSATTGHVESGAGATGDHLDRSPGRTSAILAIGMATLAIIIVPSAFMVVVGVPGTMLVALGAGLGSRRAISYGTVLLLVGVLLAGVNDIQPEPLVLCTLLSILAWDAGRYGITIGDQLGRKAATSRIELAHTALNAAVGTAGVGLGYGMYLLVVDEQSVAALILLLFGVAILFATLR